MKILDDIPFDLEPDILFKRMHLDADGDYADEIRTLVQKAAQIARPKAIYDIVFIDEKDINSVVVNNVRLTSPVLRANLNNVERVFPYVATCGTELDSIPLSADDILGVFCRDTIKEMALRAAMSFLSRHLKETYALKKMASMNPGSGNVNVWPIQQQKELFSLFGNVEQSIGVELTDTCLMIPNKSLSGLFYATEIDFVSCQLCHREACPGRQAPFDRDSRKEKIEEN